MAENRTRSLRFLVTGALLIGPAASGCGDEPVLTTNEPPSVVELEEPLVPSTQEQGSESPPSMDPTAVDPAAMVVPTDRVAPQIGRRQRPTPNLPSMHNEASMRDLGALDEL